MDALECMVQWKSLRCFDSDPPFSSHMPVFFISVWNFVCYDKEISTWCFWWLQNFEAYRRAHAHIREKIAVCLLIISWCIRTIIILSQWLEKKRWSGFNDTQFTNFDRQKDIQWKFCTVPSVIKKVNAHCQQTCTLHASQSTNKHKFKRKVVHNCTDLLKSCLKLLGAFKRMDQ